MTTNDSRQSEIPNQRSLTRRLGGRCAVPQRAQRATRVRLGAVAGMVALCGAAWAATNDGTQVLQTNRNGNGKVCQSLADFPVACRAVASVPGEAPSLLPEGR